MLKSGLGVSVYFYSGHPLSLPNPTSHSGITLKLRTHIPAAYHTALYMWLIRTKHRNTLRIRLKKWKPYFRRNYKRHGTIGPPVSSFFLRLYVEIKYRRERERRVCSRYRKAILHNLPGYSWNIAYSRKILIIDRNDSERKATLDTRSVVVSLNLSYNARLSSWQIVIQQIIRTAWS
jgi:hypothetical protein